MYGNWKVYIFFDRIIRGEMMMMNFEGSREKKIKIN
jgi:hypothetical protein